LWFEPDVALGIFAASSIFPQALLPYLSWAAFIQFLGIIVMIIVFRVENPVEVTVLVKNPDKKPYSLY
jgi:hypothetical protein